MRRFKASQRNRFPLSLLCLLALAAPGCERSDGGLDASASDGSTPLWDADVITDAGPADAGGQRVDDAGAVGSDAGPAHTGVVHAYTEDEASVPGPERGFYAFANIVDTTDLSSVADAGYRLVFSYIRLDDYRETDIPSSLFEAANGGFSAARAAGLKVILRFAYNVGPYPDAEPDASLERVLAHIQQLRPLLAENADVIAVVQAGFVGAWGEWHSSTYGLTDDPVTRRAIIEALVDAMPPGLSIQIRNPVYKEQMYGAARTAANAHDESYGARVGHHNDCFLASDTDFGTYPDDDVERVTNYVAADTLFVPMGGETCASYPTRTDCAPALVEFERLHISYMNEDYHPDVIDGWREQGCHPELARRMGYRLVVETASFPDTLDAGSRAAIEITIRNEGWAAPFNPRTLFVRLGQEVARVALDRDAQWLLPGQSTVLRAILDVPSSASGSLPLTLSAPDRHPTIAERSEYALPFANITYDATRGELSLGTMDIE